MKIEKVYVLQHRNPGEPDSGEIEGIYATKKLAMSIMEDLLINEYDSSLEKNKEDMCMLISEYYLEI
jgi:hypothetical protein